MPSQRNAKITEPTRAATTPDIVPGAQFRILANEPRIVTERTIQKLKASGASSDLIAAAERAAKTNPA